MNFDPGVFLASLLVSSIGFVLLVYGKRQSRIPHVAVGVLLLVYPYFLESVVLMLGIAAVLLGGLWFAVKRLAW